MTSNYTSHADISWKGKSKDVPADFDDLNPIITYRHLLSQTLGVRDPLRVVGLCDMDAFYAACEQVRLGLDPSRPLVVLQWESLIAVNYPARKFGISRMAKLKDAKRMCPELVVQHVATYREGELEPGYWDDFDSRTHKVSLDYYRRESMKIIQIFKTGLPNSEIEKASIDEAFIDFTRPVREIILQRFPYLAQVPQDAPEGLDTPLPRPPPLAWDGLGVLIPITLTSEASVEPSRSGVDAEVSADEDAFTTWHDVALSIAAELMEKIRFDIRGQLGYNTSAGIARNKFLAKLSASYKKPNTQSILRNAAIPNYLRPMGFQKIRFLGGKLGAAIAEEYDVKTVGDLLIISLDEMQRKFGEGAFWVYELLRGIDRGEVKEKSAQNKSMLASKNLPTPITKASDGYHWLRVLAAELALRLNDARKINGTLWPKSLVLHARKGYQTARSKQAAFPFSRVVTVDLIADAANKLWKELVGEATAMQVTSVQLSFTGLEPAESGQQGIEGFFKTPDRALGPPMAGPSRKRSRDSDDDDGALPRIEPLVEMEAGLEAMHDATISFICSKCGKSIALDEHFSGDGVEDEIRAQALEALRVEHDDFHFAHALSKAPLSPQKGRKPETAKKKKKTGTEPKGIAKFFTKK